MIQAEVLTHLINNTNGSQLLVNKRRFVDAQLKKPTIRWAKNLIREYFPEFVISDCLILIHKTKKGYIAARSCTQSESKSGYSFKYLEIKTVS